MWTGQKAERETYSSEWRYFLEGNAHMIFFNNHQEASNTYQDKVLVGEKAGGEMYMSENKVVNEIFDRCYNNVFLRNEKFGQFLTKQKLVDVKEGETVGEFMENLMKEADPKRREDRKVARLVPESRFWLEKNLYYLSPMNLAHFKENDCLVFFAEIKPKCCFDEIPTFNEISELLTANPDAANIDHQKFYDVLFKNCPPSERKYVYRKLVGGKHQILSEFNTADFYSERPYVRAKAIKALIKEDWGNYLKILDKDQNIIPHGEILNFFRAWDPQITLKSISEIIARSFNQDLIRMVAGLQKFFQFYADRLIQVEEILEQKKHSITEEQLTTVMQEFEKVWAAGETVDLEAIEKAVGEDLAPIADIVAFLISLTSRDSSFLLKSAVSRTGDNFEVLETWEHGKVAQKVDNLHVEFYNATAVSKDNNDFDAEKQQNILADLFEKKFANSLMGKAQVKREEHHEDERRDYRIKSTTNLCDVGIKPWNKVHTYVKANHKINKNFVDFFVKEKGGDFVKAE